MEKNALNSLSWCPGLTWFKLVSQSGQVGLQLVKLVFNWPSWCLAFLVYQLAGLQELIS